jgi:hypothetical protein
MLVLTKNSSNTIRVSLAELSTLSNPVYLIEFISDTSLISTTCIAPDTSSYPARYNEFTITEQTSPDGLLAQILLEPVGFFTYNIYEQTSATNLAPNAPGTVLLETGKARVLIDGDRQSTAFSYYQNPTQDFHAWDVFNSEGISPAPPSTDATYQNSDSSFTQVIAPGVTYTAPDISVTDSDGSVSNVPANTDVVCTPAVSGTIYARPTPRFGLSSSYATYDDGWQYQNGTYTTGYAQSSGTMQTLDATDLNSETLTLDNQWGNKNRFTDGNGNQDWANAVAGDLNDRRWLTQDHLTGLEWINHDIFSATNGFYSSSNYINNLNFAAGLSIYGYSDYRIAAIHEINSIPYNSSSTYFNNAFFRLTLFTTRVVSCSMRTTTRFFQRNTNGEIEGSTQITSSSTQITCILRTM